MRTHLRGRPDEGLEPLCHLSIVHEELPFTKTAAQMSATPYRVTKDYFISEAQVLDALGLEIGKYFVVNVQRKAGRVYGKSGQLVGDLSLEGWQVTVVEA